MTPEETAQTLAEIKERRKRREGETYSLFQFSQLIEELNGEGARLCLVAESLQKTIAEQAADLLEAQNGAANLLLRCGSQAAEIERLKATVAGLHAHIDEQGAL